MALLLNPVSVSIERKSADSTVEDPLPVRPSPALLNHRGRSNSCVSGASQH